MKVHNVPIDYSDDARIPIECLSERNWFAHRMLLTYPLWNRHRFANCTIEFPKNHSVVSGSFFFNETGCTGAKIDFDCFPGSYLTVCAPFVVKRDRNGTWLYTQAIFGNRTREMQSSIPDFTGARMKTITVNNHTLAVILRYLAHDPFLAPGEVYFCSDASSVAQQHRGLLSNLKHDDGQSSFLAVPPDNHFGFSILLLSGTFVKGSDDDHQAR